MQVKLNNPQSNKSGQLIVFEGCDKCGKSTTSSIIKDKLQNLNLKVKLMQFPDRKTQIGQIIDQHLKKQIQLNDQVAHLLFSANRWEFRDLIVQYLNDGYIVLLDRYIYSGLIFSICKGLDYFWCKFPDIGLPQPDLIVYMQQQKVPIYNDDDNEIYETLEFQQKVSLQFDKLFMHKDQVYKSQDVELIYQKIHKLLKEKQIVVDEVNEIKLNK